MDRILIAYFSVGGVTATIARAISNMSGADLYEIVPAEYYTKEDLNWQNTKSRSSLEMVNPLCRPKISGKLPDISGYDTILIGFPIWWYVAPRIVDTFLESLDFTGKVVIPFATSGETDIVNAQKRMEAIVNGTPTWKRGAVLNRKSGDAIKSWLLEKGVIE